VLTKKKIQNMKTKINHLILAMFLIIAPAVSVLADNPDAPPFPGGDPGVGGGTPVGAPIDGGLSILLALGAGYGGCRLYKAKKKEEDTVD
jgi:hypothetical protein